MFATMFLFRLGCNFWCWSFCCRSLCCWNLGWCCDGLDFIFRCNESIFLEHSVLLSNSLRHLLGGLDAEFLYCEKENIKNCQCFEVNLDSPQDEACGCSADEPWSFSWLPSCSQRLCIAIQLRERHGRLDRTCDLGGGTRSSWRVERRLASVCHTEVECLRRPSSG